MPRFGLLTIAIIGLLLRVGYAVITYEPSLLNYHSGDYREYSNAAEDILQGDLEFKNSVYLVRPPLFPLLVAALGIQPLLIIAANILLGAAVIPLTYFLARHFAPPPPILRRSWPCWRRVSLLLTPPAFDIPASCWQSRWQTFCWHSLS